MLAKDLEMQTTGSNLSDKNFYGLELLRFLCAFAILAWHYQHFFYVGNAHASAGFAGFSPEAQPFYKALFIPYHWGSNAVQIFWILSGFIFFWKYAGPISLRRMTAGKFFLLRFSRLYPLHFVTLIAVAVLQWVYTGSHACAFVYSCNDPWHFVLNVFFAPYWGLQKGFSFNGPVWSVSVELLAYGAFFMAARRVRLTPRAVIPIVAVLFAAKLLTPGPGDVVLCLLCFFVGGAVHLFASRHGSRLGWAWLGSALCSAGLLGSSAALNGKPYIFGVIALSVSLLLGFLIIGRAIREPRARRLCTCLGNLTYSSYLLHFPVQLGAVILSDHFAISRSVYDQPRVFLLFVAATFLISRATFVFLERPTQEWLRSKFSRAGRGALRAVPVQA